MLPDAVTDDSRKLTLEVLEVLGIAGFTVVAIQFSEFKKSLAERSHDTLYVPQGFIPCPFSAWEALPVLFLQVSVAVKLRNFEYWYGHSNANEV